MPIYLVRWPALRVSLIRASNEQHLVDILDELGDTGGCRWMVYKGPLWFDLELPVNLNWDDNAKGPRTDADVQIEGVDELKASGLVFEASLPLSDTAGEMGEEVARRAFPHLNRVFNEADIEVLPLRSRRSFGRCKPSCMNCYSTTGVRPRWIRPRVCAPPKHGFDSGAALAEAHDC
jgi:hypothetical protein